MEEAKFEIGENVKLVTDDVAYKVTLVNKGKYQYEYNIEGENGEILSNIKEINLSKLID